MTDERWADIPGHPGYQASSLGQVRSIKKNPARVIVPYRQNGYLRVRLYGPATGRGRQFRVHRLILMAFRGPPAEGRGVGRHLNGNPLDNHLDNLAWGTLGDNAQDAIRHGRASCIRRGERHPGSKLTDAQFAEVGRLARAGVNRKLLAERFGITPNYAWRSAMAEVERPQDTKNELPTGQLSRRPPSSIVPIGRTSRLPLMLLAVTSGLPSEPG